MKRFIQTGIVLTIAFVLWQVSADARFLDLQKQEQVPALNPEIAPTPQPVTPSYNSEVQPKGISLHFENLSLINVLRNIQEETGILFSIDPSLETVPFSATVQADNWEEAVKEILKGFSRVEVWTSNLESSRVWVMAGSLEESKTKEPDIRLSRQAIPTPIPARQRPPQVQLHPVPVIQPVASSATRIENLPPHILFEPGVLTFFKSKGIQLPENVKNMFGPNLEGLPANMPISPHILNDPTFINFLNSQGIQPPV